jgi:hypothetical protein
VDDQLALVAQQDDLPSRLDDVKALPMRPSDDLREYAEPVYVV